MIEKIIDTYFENIIKPYITNDEIKFLNFQLKQIL